MKLADLKRLTDQEARELLESVLWPEGPVCPHCGTTQSCLGHWLFIGALGSIALGILAGGAVLFEEVAIYNNLVKQTAEAILRNKDGGPWPKHIVAKTSKWYDAMVYVFFSSLSIAAILLVLYAAVVHLPR